MSLSSYAQGTLTIAALNTPQSLTGGTGIGTLGSYFAEFDITALAASDVFKAWIVSATLLNGVVNQLTNDASVTGPSSGLVVKKYVTGVGSIWTFGDIMVEMTAGSVTGKTFPFRIGQFN